MCGISGVFRLHGRGDDIAAVRGMNARLQRRGPDDEGVLADGPVTLGNRRLAILDLSPAGHQPMESPSGRFLLTFNGEIYNHRDLARELGLDDRERRSQADTEVLLCAWERWGEAALERCVGQWAFACYDRAEQRLWLARDRFGEKPLYYHRSAAAVAFASSIAALFAAPWIPRELDPEALLEYLAIRYVVAPRTVAAGVAKLPPGHLLRIDARGVELRRWYRPVFRRAAGRRRRAELVEEFDALFQRAAVRCLESDRPVALFLSDGIDSNSIHAALQAAGREVPAYTFVPVADGTDASLGDRRADGAVEVRVPIRERVARMVSAFGALTEPVGDGAALATWFLIRGARERATVFLCGHGGDEILGGYRLSHDRFRVALLRSLAFLPAAWLRGHAERYFAGDEPFAARWARLRSASFAKAPDVLRYLIHRPLPADDLRTLRPAAGFGLDYLASIDRLYAECGGRGPLDRMQEVLLHTFLSSNLLSWADAVAMDASAELRLPYLDRDLVEFVCGLPADLRAPWWPGRANTKRILRLWGRGRLDAAVLRRGKNGFPFGNLPELLRSDGRTLRSALLDASPLRRELPGLEAWLERPPEAFREPWESTLWALLALAWWSRAAGLA
jgi:asparagine synthase (glutamine-hydrolysing)